VFDKACTVNTIYFWSDAAASAFELYRVIAAGGRLVIGFAPRETLDRLPVTEHGFAKSTKWMRFVHFYLSRASTR
jgi:hypothetical protein